MLIFSLKNKETSFNQPVWTLEKQKPVPKPLQLNIALQDLSLMTKITDFFSFFSKQHENLFIIPPRICKS